MKTNGKPTLREIWLGRMKSAGYHDDTREYVRVIVERQGVRREALDEAWRIGKRMRDSGVPCSCRECSPIGAR